MGLERRWHHSYRAMKVLFTAAVLLTLTNLVMGTLCRSYQGSSSRYCGGGPQMQMADPSTVEWNTSSSVSHSYVEVRKVNDIWSETGCLNSYEVTSFRAFPPSIPSYTFPITDYDSLYIAKVVWLDYRYRAYYRNNSECYFIPQRPSPPIPSVFISDITARSVTISLNGCTSLNSRYGPVKYIVQYSLSGGQELTTEAVATVTTTTVEIKGLSAETSYTFTITCANVANQTGPSNSATATTKAEDTLQPNISSVAVDNALMFADVSWDGPSEVNLVTGYDIQVAMVPHVGGIPQSPSVHLMASSSRYSRSYRVMQNLMPETVYTFQVRARTSVGTSQWSIPVAVTTLPVVPTKVSGLSLNSSSSTIITMSWRGSNTTIDYYMLVLHNVETNATESNDLFHTVYSHTFHNLSPSTAYSVTIAAVNKAGSGPLVSVNVTTQKGPDGRGVQPLAVTTGIFVTIVFIGAAGFVLTVGVWCTGRYVIPKLQGLNKREDECEIEENIAYATVHGDRLWSQNFFLYKKEEVGCEEDCVGYEGEGEGIPEVDYAPDIPSREYLKEKEKGPTEFASLPVYPDEESFHKESGWFESAPADVIAAKLAMDGAAFADLGSGVYLMRHRTKKQAKWVGLSPDLCRTLCGLFFQLYQKERFKLSPIEVELKFFSPLAADWDIQVWTAESKELVLERAKKIVEFKTLTPRGLNISLTLTGKEMWEEFSSWFQAKKRKQM